MAQEMSDAEQEYLQALVHRIATHIVEGSAAVQELKSTVARLKNERSDIEYAVYEHWLKAAKTIEAAGKEKSSWEKFIKSLRMSYGDDENDDDDKQIALSGTRRGGPSASAPGPGPGPGPGSAPGGEREEDHLLPIASQELWAHAACLRNNNHVGTSSAPDPVDHRFVPETVVVVDRGGGNRFGKQSEIQKKLSDSSERRVPVAVAYDTERLAQAAMTIGEPNDKLKSTPKGVKRKLEESSSVLVGTEGGGGKKKSFIQFTNGRKVGGDKVVALKKDGRCFYCERKGHRAAECKDNPDIQGKLP